MCFLPLPEHATSAFNEFGKLNVAIMNCLHVLIQALMISHLGYWNSVHFLH